MTILPPVTPPINPPPPTVANAGSYSPSLPAPDSPPFLVWPVSRREFYRAICISMLPAIGSGLFIFGVRPLTMLLCAIAAVTFVHILLKRWLRWQRAQSLVSSHCLVCAMVLVGLSHPLWPVWIVLAAAILIPFILALLGGPGRERTHVAVVLVLALQFAIMPLLAHSNTYAGGAGGRVEAGSSAKRDAILARDRLLMGDIREQQPGSLYQWPSSRDLQGSDAVQMTPPAQTAANLLDDLSLRLADNAGIHGTTTILSESNRMALTQLFDNAFAFQMPGMEMQVLGAVPGRVATVSLPGIVIAGLYLSYRYILRPRSVLCFAFAFIVGSILFAFTPNAIAHAGPVGLWSLLKTFPGEIATLINFLILNSDAAFATVFILALPGTEPLTPRGRRIFLGLAGVTAALLHRLEPTLPAAALSLCAFMPITRLFDRLFAKRSWLNG